MPLHFSPYFVYQYWDFWVEVNFFQSHDKLLLYLNFLFLRWGAAMLPRSVLNSWDQGINPITTSWVAGNTVTCCPVMLFYYKSCKWFYYMWTWYITERNNLHMQIFINILILQKNQFNCDILLHAYVLFISASHYLLLPSPSYTYYSPIIFLLLSDHLIFQDSTHREIHMTCQNLPYFTWQHDLKLLFTFHICPCWCPLIFSD
jgi:hypothetical protein